MLKGKDKNIRAIFVARGAALVEFALVLPLILLFLAGIFTLARAQSQVNILAQAAYQIAFIGATTTEANGNGDAAMLSQGASILAISRLQTNYLDTLTITRPIATSISPPVITQSAYYVDPADQNTYVTVEVRGTVSSIFHYFLPSLFTLTVDVTAPYLNGGAAQSNITVSGVLNPSTTLGCDGSPGIALDCSTRVCGCQPDGSNKCLGSGTTPICYP